MRSRVKHLASRAGFGATQAETEALTGRSAAQALAFLQAAQRSLPRRHFNIQESSIPVSIHFRPAVRPLPSWPSDRVMLWALKLNPAVIAPLQPIVNTFLLVARKPWKLTAWRIGGLTGCSAANALCKKSGAVLARSFRHQRRQSARLPEDGAAGGNISAPRSW